jgi:hypothetical protein
VLQTKRRSDRRGIFDRRRLDVGPPHGSSDRRSGERRAHHRMRNEQPAAHAAVGRGSFGRMFKRREQPEDVVTREQRGQVEAQLERVLRLSSIK